MPLSDADKKRRQRNREVAQSWWPDGEERTVWVVPDGVIYDLDLAIDLVPGVIYDLEQKSEPIEVSAAERAGIVEGVTRDELVQFIDIDSVATVSIRAQLRRIEEKLDLLLSTVAKDVTPNYVVPVNTDLLSPWPERPVDRSGQ